MTDTSVTLNASITIDATQLASMLPPGASGAPGVSPTAASVASVLAATPSFVAAVAALLAPPVVTPPAPTPTPPAPTAGVSWVFNAGKLFWEGDWSFGPGPNGVGNIAINYNDTANPAPDGTPSISVTGGQWAGWQPFINAGCQSDVDLCFVTNPYQFLTFMVKPTVANQKLGGAVLSSQDTPDGKQIQDFSAYGPTNPPIGEWSTFKVPLSIFGLTDLTILKFSISDQTGLAANKYNLCSVGFSET